MVVIFSLKVQKQVGTDQLAYMTNSLIKYVIEVLDDFMDFPIFIDQ
jgi:hypothetical protein